MIANGSTDGRGANSKESFQLLADISSDSGSDGMMPEFTQPKRKIKLKRKLRNGVVGSSRSGAAAAMRQQLRDCSAVIVFKILGVLVVSAGLGITVWLTITLHIRVDELRRQYLLAKLDLYSVLKPLSDPDDKPRTSDAVRIISGDGGGGGDGNIGSIVVSVNKRQRMKKRKELDALVPCNGIGGTKKKKVLRAKRNHSSGSGSTGTELLGSGGRSTSDTTDVEEFSMLQHQQHRVEFGKKSSFVFRICGSCLPLCTLIMVLVTACMVGSGILLWMQFGIRQEVDLLRDHIRKVLRFQSARIRYYCTDYDLGGVEEGSKGTPVEFHGIHSQLKELQNNQTALRDYVSTVNRTIDNITKEISALRLGVSDLKKSLAETPELETLPKDFKELQSTLASMGSKITNFESNLAQVRSQLATSVQDKGEFDGELEALRQKVDSLTSVPHTANDSQKVFAYVNAEVKKVDDMIVDVNSTIWEKMLWAVSDLHEHHKMITNLQAGMQNVTHWMAEQESIAPSMAPVQQQQQQQTALKEQVEHVINEMAASLLANSSTSSLFDGNRTTITVATLLDYVRNLTKLYVTLLANGDRLRAALLNDDKLLMSSTVDLNVTRVLHTEVEELVRTATNEQTTNIMKLKANVANCLQSWNSSLNNVSILSDRLIALQNQVEHLFSALRTSTVQPVKTSSTSTTTPTSQSTLVDKNPQTTTSKPIGISTLATQTATVASAIANSTVSVDNNGTLATTQDKVFKPIHTGGTFEDPQQRKPEDADTD